MHRGVYAVGHRALRVEGRWLAAVLACGEGAFLSHRSAAALWGIRPTGRLDIDVSSPQASGRGLKGVDLALGAAPRGPGNVALRSAVADLEPAEGTSRSPFEERFRGLCHDIDVPQPRVNEWIVVPQRELVADFVWRRERLVVETDGHRFHSSRAAFERDRRRDQWLVLDGWRVVRVTWRQLATRPDEVRRMVAALLHAGRNV